MRVRVAVIIVSWNTVELLGRCLRAYDEQDHPDVEVVVVDNASDDGSAALLDRVDEQPRRHPLRVVHTGANLGFAGAVNTGLAVTDAPVVAFSNVDVVPAPDLLSIALATLLADDRRGTVAPKLLRTTAAPDGRDVLDSAGHELTSARLIRNRGEGAVDEGRFDEPGPVFGASGALVVHRRAMLDDVAWRDTASGQVLTEDLFAFFEDVELDWRARLLGWDAWYEPRAVARHQRGGAGPRRTPQVEALNWANRLLVVATCDDRAGLLRCAPLVATTTLLKTAEMVLTVPWAVPTAFGRLRRLRGVRARRRELLGRAVRSPREVTAQWVVPFRVGPWVGGWWRRVSGRAIGVDRGEPGHAGDGGRS